ncbi:MAG: TAXI family TRAP transporter solute-binding subunit [Crocinitomicaceae bacterium]
MFEIKNATNFIKVLLNSPKRKIRQIILPISIPPAILFYSLVVGWINEENVLVEFFSSFRKQEINFYSGTPKGFYYSIGKELKKTSERLVIKNDSTTGSNMNYFKVLGDKRSFGIVQEEVLNSANFLDEHISIISPLYMERLHILYRKDAFDSFTGRDAHLMLSTSTPLSTLNFIAENQIGTGPIGSGTRQVASYLLDELQSQRDSTLVSENIHYVTLDYGLELLENDSIQIFFAMIGAPIKDIYEILKTNDDIALASLSPGLISAIAKNSGNNYMVSNFVNKYDIDDQAISTLSTYSYLIANNHISSLETRKLLAALNSPELKDTLRKNSISDSTQTFQLDELDYYNIYRKQDSEEIYQKIKGLGIFILTFISSILGVFTALTWLVSLYKKNNYFKRIMNIVKDSIYGNDQSNSVDDFIAENILNKIVLNLKKNEIHTEDVVDPREMTLSEINKSANAINKLFSMSNSLHTDYATGGIIDEHHKFLSELLMRTRDSLRKKLLQQLNEMMETKYPIQKSILIDYYTRGYLELDGYKFLIAKVK